MDTALTDTTMRVTQPDGSTFNARLTPAKVGGRPEVDGFTVVRGADGWWRYAASAAHGSVKSSTAIVGKSPRPSGLVKGIGRISAPAGDPQSALAAKLHTALGMAMGKGDRANAAPAVATPGHPTIFKFPVLMLATWWDSAAGQTSPQFQPETDTAKYFKAILDGFGGNPKGTLTEFYFENSYGQFLVQVDVFGPYVSNRSRQDRCYYGGIDPPPDVTDDLDPTDNLFGVGGVGVAGMAVEGVPQADPDVDFAQYDNDGDGYVDFMGVIHSGADMAVTGDPCNTWSHALPLSAFGDIAEGILGLPSDTFRGGLPTTDGVLIDRAFTMPEFDEKGGGLNIGVAAHEMAHALGEPDYYAVNGTSSGDGDWDIMSGGSYMGNPSGSNPAWFNPASRVFQGWTTPTIVHGSLRNRELRPRETPLPGYTAAKPNPNLLLVPTRWIKVGDTDDTDHVWTENDVYGLVLDKGAPGGPAYVVEGWYLEYVSRLAGRHPPIHAGMTRSPYFDRADHGSGLLTWHFDYWRRSNVYFNNNDAQNDPNRMQMDVEEWDFNDNTQEIALNQHRGESSDPVHPTATGITSGTHRNNPAVPDIKGTPQTPIALSGGPVLGPTSYDAPFQVSANPANYTMRVRVAGQGDCILQLFRKVNGKEVPASDSVDSGGPADEELIAITRPQPGDWIARVTDFAACGLFSGSVEFSAPTDFDARGTGDTWSNLTEEPTGWAFTNVRSGGTSRSLDLGSESGFANRLTLDILQLKGTVDFSPGYVTPETVVSAGTSNRMTVPIFSNGSRPGDVSVAVREGGPTGKLVAQGTVALAGYSNGLFRFSYTPRAEGPTQLYVAVDPAGVINEGSEANNTQLGTGWAGPRNPRVLVVDDEGYTDGEESYTGALAALGVPYAVINRHATAAQMKKYDAVIWVAAIDRGPGQLDTGDRAAIASYLNDGGKLWLASNRAAGAVELEDDAAFVNHYFGAMTVETTTLERPHSVAGTGKLVPAALRFELQPYPIRPFSDIVKLAPKTDIFGTGAEILKLAKANKPGRDGGAFGTRVVGDSAHGSFRTVLTPFSLSQASSADTWVALTRIVMKDFGVQTGASRRGAHLFFHSDIRFQVSGRATPVTAISLGDDASPVRVFYRVHGSSAFTALTMNRGREPGTYTAVMPGSAVTPSGVDYSLKSGRRSTYDPAPAATRALTHAIAVAIPEVPVTRPPASNPRPTSDALPATGPRTPLLLLAATLLLLGLVFGRALTRPRGLVRDLSRRSRSC